jgi:hypothetical protein
VRDAIVDARQLARSSSAHASMVRTWMRACLIRRWVGKLGLKHWVKICWMTKVTFSRSFLDKDCHE